MSRLLRYPVTAKLYKNAIRSMTKLVILVCRWADVKENTTIYGVKYPVDDSKGLTKLHSVIDFISD